MNESKFTGGVLGLIGTRLKIMFLYVFTLGIGLPWCICIWNKWIADHTVIDNKQVVFDGKGSQVFGSFVKWWLLCFITGGIYMLWMKVNIQKWVTKHTHLQ